MVVDTNVGIVANGGADHVRLSCVKACVDALQMVVSQGRILLDDEMHILIEYHRHLCPSGAPGVGDMFMKWVWQNQGNESMCLRVPITEHTVRGFLD